MLCSVLCSVTCAIHDRLHDRVVPSFNVEMCMRCCCPRKVFACQKRIGTMHRRIEKFSLVLSRYFGCHLPIRLKLKLTMLYSIAVTHRIIYSRSTSTPPSTETKEGKRKIFPWHIYIGIIIGSVTICWFIHVKIIRIWSIYFSYLRLLKAFGSAPESFHRSLVRLYSFRKCVDGMHGKWCVVVVVGELIAWLELQKREKWRKSAIHSSVWLQRGTHHDLFGHHSNAPCSLFIVGIRQMNGCNARSTGHTQLKQNGIKMRDHLSSCCISKWWKSGRAMRDMH